MDKESPEERLKKVEIKPVERECLDRVFRKLSIISYDPNSIVNLTPDKPKEAKEKISASDLMRALQILGEKPAKSDVDLMIWVYF